MVGKTRDVLRPIVADALAAGIRPAIYGGGWRNLVDPSLIVADHVPNEQVPVVYRSAGVVLNDHWHTMRAWGFVSNRIFDVLACGAPVISDHLPEIEDLLGDAVATYTTPAELSERSRGRAGRPGGRPPAGRGGPSRGSRSAHIRPPCASTSRVARRLRARRGADLK